MSKTANVDEPIKIGYKQFVDYAFLLWLDSLKTGKPLRTLCLLGPPGIGKSSMAYALAEKMTGYVRTHPEIIIEAARRFYGSLDSDKALSEALIESTAACRLLDFSSMLPEDLNGLPFRDGDHTVYCPQRWAAELTGPLSYGVVVQDDLPAAAPAMHTAGRQMALERRIHDHRFAPGVLVMVTGNRREDKSAAKTLPAHFRNSVCLLSIEPDLDQWKKWYGRQVGLNALIPAFLTWQPQLFSLLPSDDDKAGAFPSPRQWASLGAQYDAARAACSPESTDVLLAVSAGLIGVGHATSFVGFVETFSKLPDPERVLDNPKGVMPNPDDTLDTIDKKIAMTISLGDTAARRWKRGNEDEKSDAALKLMYAVAHTCGVAGEFTATGVQTFLDGGGNLTALAKVAKERRGDRVLGPMLDHLKSALLGGQ